MPYQQQQESTTATFADGRHGFRCTSNDDRFPEYRVEADETILYIFVTDSYEMVNPTGRVLWKLKSKRNKIQISQLNIESTNVLYNSI